MKDYIILDIESPNKKKYSVSAIGIVIIKNNKIIGTKYSLINPEDFFDYEIIKMTGITQEKVKDSPKFYEYWPEIRELLSEYPIIGHNIEYDLKVISRTLDRYGLEIPVFEYLCTLKNSYKYLNLKSYKLTEIMKSLNVDYDAHNALEDAKATYTLFKYLEQYHQFTLLDTQTFYLKTENKKKIDDKLTPCINELYGMLTDIKYKDDMTVNEKNLLSEWIIENNDKSDNHWIKTIITKLKCIIMIEDFTRDDLNKMSTITSSISKSQLYSIEELNYQVLNGIIKMMDAGDRVTKSEYIFLKKFVNFYDLPDSVDKQKVLNSFKVAD